MSAKPIESEPIRAVGKNATARISPQHCYVSPSEICTLSVLVENDDDSLGCLQCIVSFDTTLVTLLVAEEGALIEQASDPRFFVWDPIAPDTHSVEGCILGYKTYVLLPGEIARFVFRAEENGVCPVKITKLTLADIDRIWYTPEVDPNAWIIIGPATGIELPPPTEGCLESYPNPFNPSTTIVFLPVQDRQTNGQLRGGVSIAIYAPDGRLVRQLFEGKADAGATRLVWDGQNQEGNAVTSGVYFAVAKTQRESYTTKLVLIR